MYKIARFIKEFGFPAAALLFPIIVSATAIQGPTGVNAPSNILSQTSDVTGSVCAIVNWLFYGLIVFAVVMVLIAAYGYLTSNGDPEKTGAAGKKLMYAAIAIIVGIIAKAFPDLISNFIGGGNYSGSVFNCGGGGGGGSSLQI